MMNHPEDPIKLTSVVLILAMLVLLLSGCATRVAYRESATFTVEPQVLQPCGVAPTMQKNPSPFVVLMQKTEEARIASCEKTRRAIMIESYNKYLEAKRASAPKSGE